MQQGHGMFFLDEGNLNPSALRGVDNSLIGQRRAKLNAN